MKENKISIHNDGTIARNSSNDRNAKLSTTLNKLGSVRNEANRVILKKFYDYMRSKDLKSDHHINNLLTLLISLDKFLCKDGPDIPFISINSREQILTFLDHQYSQKVAKWVKRC